MPPIYFDNNATTRACDEAATAMHGWVQSCSNPSGASHVSGASRLMIERAQAVVERLCSLAGEYHVIFTSGASESNCGIIEMIARAWHRTGTSRTVRPHFVTSSVEHKSVISCLEALHETGAADYTLVEPTMWGTVRVEDVVAALRPETALCSIMFANNETGAINPVREISAAVHARGVPFHTDAVQIFGKVRLDLPARGIDALSMSFHKLEGPVGVGMLIVRRALVDGYGLRGVISGTQQSGLRGGTENVPGIAGGAAAIHHAFAHRDAKNRRMQALRDLLLRLLASRFTIEDYASFYDVGDAVPALAGPATRAASRTLVVLGPAQKNAVLPNTVLLAVIDRARVFCNVRFKRELEREGVIVSIGSACATSSAAASHVLMAMRAPPIVRRGVLRISFSDTNTAVEVRQFVVAFCAALLRV